MAELDHLKADPAERRNLIADPGSAAVVARLRSQLAEAMRATGLTPENDTMPLDEGIKQQLPDQKIR
ncbi:MAG: hypothetical protein HY736_12085 [Verrucomicrobia bacterium]|nr:hypothetical protein [Verrucomicrobiota bacterium]